MSTKAEPTQRPSGLARSPQASSHAIGRSSRRACESNIRSTRLGNCSAPIMGAFVSLSAWRICVVGGQPSFGGRLSS